MKRSTLLSEDRALRALRRGGMILGRTQKKAGQFDVMRRRDARAPIVGQVLAHQVERWLVEENIRELDRPNSDDRRFVWCGKIAQPIIAPPPEPVLASFSSRRKSCGKRRVFLEQILDLADKNAGEHIRLAAAAGRYRADVERAATPQSVTMRWDGVRVDGGRRGGGFAPGGGAISATRRLEQVEREIGAEARFILQEVLVRGISASGLARRLGVSGKAGTQRALDVLRELAETYDLSVSPVR